VIYSCERPFASEIFAPCPGGNITPTCAVVQFFIAKLGQSSCTVDAGLLMGGATNHVSSHRMRWLANNISMASFYVASHTLHWFEETEQEKTKKRQRMTDTRTSKKKCLQE